MKILIKGLLGLLFVSVIGMGVLYLLSIWQITPVPFVTGWKVVASLAGLTVIALLVNLCTKTFFGKSNTGDKSQGNKAHPLN